MIAFKYKDDPAELSPYDLLSQSVFDHTINDFQANNIDTWKLITNTNEDIISYDPEVVAHLKSLGYMK